MSTSDQQALRELVRQVLSDVLPEVAAAAAADGPPAGPVRGQRVEQVSLRNDAELDAFVHRLLALFDNPKQRADLKAGKLRFMLTSGTQPGRVAPTRRVEKGAVTEAQVKDAAKAGANLVLGRSAVLTPLARDKARALGVVVEKEA